MTGKEGVLGGAERALSSVGYCTLVHLRLSQKPFPKALFNLQPARLFLLLPSTV